MAELSFYTGFMEMAREQGIERTAEFAAKQGFSGVELLELPNHPENFLAKNEAEAFHISKVLEEYDLSVSCVSAAVNLAEEPEGEEELKRMLPIVAALGSPFLHHMLISWLTLPAHAPSYEEALPRILEKAGRVADAAKEYGLTCLYEGQGLYFNGIEGLGPFLKEMKRDHDNVGVVGDVGNPLFYGCAPEEFFRYFAGDIRHVHLKDYIVRKFDEDPGAPWLITENGAHQLYVSEKMPGDGEIALDQCMQLLKQAGYQGFYSLESVIPEPADRSLEAYREWVKKHLD